MPDEAPEARRAPVQRLGVPSPRTALVLVALAVILLLLYLGRGALTPFIVGLMLIYILDPAVRALTRRGLHPALAVLAVYAVTLVVLVEGLALLIRPLVEQIGSFMRDLPQFTAALDSQLGRLAEAYDRLRLPEGIRQAIDSAIAAATEGGAGAIDPGTLLPVARSIAGTVASVFGYLIVPVWAFYVLKDRERLTERFDQTIPEQWRVDVWAVFRIIERVLGRWLRGQLFLGLVVGGATFVGLLILGALVDQRFTTFAVLLAVVAGVLELLPILGPIIASIPAILIALTISPQALVAVVVLYVIVQQVENNVLVPKIQGDAIELHPSVVIFALVMGGAIAGLLGAILSLPLTAAGRNVYRYLWRRLDGEPPVSAARGLLAGSETEDRAHLLGTMPGTDVRTVITTAPLDTSAATAAPASKPPARRPRRSRTKTSPG
jgi:predicted PurR-regulated permease PerM